MRHDPTKPERARVPQASTNDYTREMAELRRAFVRAQTGAELRHSAQHSFEPSLLPGTVESFMGVTQVPLGVAGPLRVLGEQAQGDFFVPLATTEGTLIAGLDRALRLVDECGGIKTTVVDGALPRAPVFTLEDARAARALATWIQQHFAAIQQAAEQTTSIGKLRDLQCVTAGPNLFLRFGYATGDVAGQNLTHKATLAACEWIRSAHPDRPAYQVAGGLDADRRQAQVHALLGCGRRVVAELVVKVEPCARILGVTPTQLLRARELAQLGHALAGSGHASGSPASALAALFLATGQDLGQLAVAHAGLTYLRPLAQDELYWSLTLPGLVIGTYGGGTGLPTQREALSMLDCYGKDKADKFAEICAALALSAELVQGARDLLGETLGSDKYARNRP